MLINKDLKIFRVNDDQIYPHYICVCVHKVTEYKKLIYINTQEEENLIMFFVEYIYTS